MTLGTLAILATLMLAPGEDTREKTVSLLPTSFKGELEEHWRFEIGKRIGDGFSKGDFRLLSGDELGEGAATCSDPACLKSLAASTQSDLIVLSSVQVAEKDYTIRLTVADGLDGSTLATVEDVCDLCGAQEAVEMVADLASTLRSRVDAMAKAKPSLMLVSEPAGASVLLDGAEVGKTPMQLEVAAGEHLLALQKDGFVTEERTITAVSGVRDRLSVTLTVAKKDWRRGAWTAGWVLFGTGLAGLAAGTTLMVVHGRPYRADCEADADGDCRNLYDTQTGGIIALAAGGVATVTGIALVAVSRAGRNKKSRQRARLAPAAGGIAVRF